LFASFFPFSGKPFAQKEEGGGIVRDVKSIRSVLGQFPLSFFKPLTHLSLIPFCLHFVEKSTVLLPWW